MVQPASEERPTEQIWRRPLRIALVILALIPVVPLLGLVYLVGPFLYDDLRLDRMVVAVALDWRDFGLEVAKTRLQYEIDHQQVGQQISDSTCAFEERSDTKVVHCLWQVVVVIPIVKQPLPLSFASHAEITSEGDLR